jgi:hypothetical protein
MMGLGPFQTTLDGYVATVFRGLATPQKGSAARDQSELVPHSLQPETSRQNDFVGYFTSESVMGHFTKL